MTETSGLVASPRTPGIFWAHNDSGGGPQLFCVRRSGRSCGRVTIAGADAVDWEDVAASPDGSLFIGDIGDNQATRSEVVVYRVEEAPPPGAGQTATWPLAERIVFTYPDGPWDAEALFVDPRSEAIYVITKGSRALVLRGRPRGGALQVVAPLRLPGLVPYATAADMSSDGGYVIVATYDRAYEFRTRAGAGTSAPWVRPARSVTLPVARQREAIAYGSGGSSIVTTSEGRHAPLIERRILGLRDGV